MMPYFTKKRNYEPFETMDADSDEEDINIDRRNLIVDDNKQNNKSCCNIILKILNCGLPLKTSWKRICCAILVVVIVISVVLSIIVYIYLSRPCIVRNYTENIIPYSYNYCSNNQSLIVDTIKTSTNIQRITLFGDSQMSYTNKLYNLGENTLKKIQESYPKLNFTLITEAKSGLHIHDLRTRMCGDVIDAKSEAVIMFWDSDVTSRQDHQSIKAIEMYIQNLIEIISTMRAKVKYFAIAGPSLQGELRDGKNKNDQCLDLYQEINKNLSKIFNISYIDIRKTFMKYDREKEWNQMKGYMTFDGQHPSQDGYYVVENLFYHQLESWYYDENEDIIEDHGIDEYDQQI